MKESIEREAHPEAAANPGERSITDGDIWIGLAVCAVLVVANTVAPSTTTVWRAVLGLLVALVLPGYYFVEMLFPRRRDIDAVARWVLALLMSVAALVVLSLLISLANQHTSGIALDATVATDAACVTALLFAAAAWWRRGRVPRTEASGLTLPRGRAPTVGLVFLALLGAVTWSVTAASLADKTPELALTSPSGRLSGYPFQIHRGKTYPLRVLVTNPTGSPAQYRLVVRDARGVVAAIRLSIAANSSWSAPAPLPSTTVRKEVVRFVLYANGQPVRRVWVRYYVVP